jgi:hypothetical protein
MVSMRYDPLIYDHHGVLSILSNCKQLLTINYTNASAWTLNQIWSSKEFYNLDTFDIHMFCLWKKTMIGQLDLWDRSRKKDHDYILFLIDNWYIRRYDDNVKRYSLQWVLVYFIYIKIKIYNTWIYRTFILSKTGLH